MRQAADARPVLVEVARPVAAAVVVDGSEPLGAGPVLRLVPPRGADRGIAVPARRAADEVVLTLELPGVGGRYLQRAAESATASGWSAAEAAGLLVELQARCAYWLAGPRAGRAANGRGSLQTVRLGRSAVVWSASRWSASHASASGLHGFVRDMLGRDAVPVAAASGESVPRSFRKALAVLAAAGVEVRQVTGGATVHTGGRWTVEALGAPRLDGSLAVLREQFAAAPRCGWCGLPVIGKRCRRCAPEVTR